MYFPYFITYIVIGFTLTLVVFYWAVKNGQFKDQQRARFLPLEEEDNDAPLKASSFKRLEIYALWFLALVGLAASAAVLIFSLIHAQRL